MLLRFSIKNWMSFQDEATLEMVATREAQHPEHLEPIEKYGLNLLPVAVIYGANASGKSNLIKAMRFAQQFILDPPKPDAAIPVRQFRLNKEASKLPTSFRFEIVIGEKIYEYGVSLTAERVIHEELKIIHKASEEILFQRREGRLDPIDRFTENSALRFAFEGTHDNQLFVTNSVSQKLTEYQPVFDWFKKTLRIILPESRFRNISGITSEDHPLFEKMIRRLRSLDSGIASVRQIIVAPETVFPKAFVDQISTTLKEGQSFPTGSLFEVDGVSLRKENGEIVARRLALIHQNDCGEEIPFSFSEESDGTRRLFDLLPAFLHLEANQPEVYVIDELDRSLHSILTKDLIERYLEIRQATSSRSQLIFTTHDTQLMTQDIFRRDEIWITERNNSGASKLVAFSEFKDVRKDKDIRKSYLQGRMGGVPRIRTSRSPCEDEVPAR